MRTVARRDRRPEASSRSNDLLRKLGEPTGWSRFASRKRAISSERYLRRYDPRTTMTASEDVLTEIAAERTARNPEFPGLVDAALRRRELLRALGAQREKLGLSQTAVAAVMGTSQSAVARLEAGDVDAKLSTVERYAAALGRKVEWRIAKAPR